MSSAWRRTLSLLSLLVLAGCFQQAGESLQNGSDVNVPIEQDTATPAPVITTSDDQQTASETPPVLLTLDTVATDTPPVLMTLDTTATVPAQLGPVSPTFPPITIIAASNTPAVVASTETPMPEATTESSTTFITPGSPLGPNVTMTTPTASGGASTATPSGLVTPTALDLTSDNPVPELNAEDPCTYTVRPGDTVYRIAVAHDTSVAAMQEANPDLTGENPVIHPGDLLLIPDCEAGPAVNATPSPTGIAPIIAPAGETATPINTGGQTYTVQRGDTLYTIAQRFGVTMNSIIAANEIGDPDRLAVGQELVIPAP